MFYSVHISECIFVLSYYFYFCSASLHYENNSSKSRETYDHFTRGPSFIFSPIRGIGNVSIKITHLLPFVFINQSPFSLDVSVKITGSILRFFQIIL